MKHELSKNSTAVLVTYYQMAKACGINMSECRLLTEGDNHHFMTRRFDRTSNGEKIHMQTVAGLAHLDRDQRHSYEEIFGILRKMNLNMDATQQLYRRMVFNVVARNNDDHTKNFSFLMDRQGKWELAPAYDLCYSYKPGGRWVGQHQLSLNGKQDGFTRQDLLTVGEKMGIRRCSEIVDEIIDAVSHWHTIAQDSGVRESHTAEIEKNLLI